jgi:predicted kinase
MNYLNYNEQKSKNLILLRGVSGSGKSTVANLFVSENEVCSADDYFINVKGEYKFDSTKLKDAHNYCQIKCRLKMKNEIPIVVVANTFTREWEMEEYYKLAEEFGYRVHSIIVENRHNGKNVHGVSNDIVQAQKDRFEIKL